ncbi:hypothetical protein [Devosia indica]|uniref:hypothetical protein n=1 Tax=Devosia indica TaxID=2079253 RepID=UPI001AECFDD0|nr:hypothetical protein [Devosia indica]
MMPPQDFLKPISHAGKEVLVGCNDCAIEAKFDDRLRSVQGLRQLRVAGRECSNDLTRPLALEHRKPI